MPESVKNYQELPLVLRVDDVSKILGVSRKVAYRLTRQQGFPVVRIGEKRLCIPREKFVSWLHSNADLPLV